MQDTREAMLSWLAGALQSNAERDKMRPDPRKAATDGFMLNVACVSSVVVSDSGSTKLT